jgi:hypothetical protein
MKKFILLLLLGTSHSYAKDPTFRVQLIVEPDFNSKQEAVYIQNGKEIRVKNLDDLIPCFQNSSRSSGAMVGEYGKFEGSRIKAALTNLKVIDGKSRIGFKADKDYEGHVFATGTGATATYFTCPKNVDYFYMIPKVVVTQLWELPGVSSSGEICDMIKDSVNKCLQKIDAIDNDTCDISKGPEMGDYFKLRKGNGYILLDPSLKKM